MGGVCDKVLGIGALVGLKGLVSSLLLIFFWVLLKVFLVFLDTKGGTTVVGGAVSSSSSSSEMVDSLDVDVVTSLELDVVRLSNMGSSVHAWIGVPLLLSSELFTETGLDLFAGLQTTILVIRLLI